MAKVMREEGKKKVIKKVGNVKEAESTDIELLRAEILTCKGDEKQYSELIKNLSAVQVMQIATYVGTKEMRLSELNAAIAESTKALSDEASLISTQIAPMKEALLKAMEDKHQKTVMTPEGWFAQAKAGRSVSEFTCTITEFIAILQEAGHSDAIDTVLKIGKTAAESVLGKTVVNRITKTTKPEYGSVEIIKA